MKRRFDWHCVVGITLVAAVAAILFAVFSLMNRPNWEELPLTDGRDERHGWRYELLVDDAVRPWEPEFGEDGYTLALPVGTRAVRIARTMTEDVADAELEWYVYGEGVEVFLDGDLLHSDFQHGAQRGTDGFLRPTTEEWERLLRAQGDATRRVRMSLPADYAGRELCVITYFTEGAEYPRPVYPRLSSENAYIASFTVRFVRYNVALTVYAMLALLIAVMFMLDAFNGAADAKTLLLCLYFLVLFLDGTNASHAGYYSALNALRLDVLNNLYVAPLYLYLALRLKWRWRYPLFAAVGVWALCEGAWSFVNVRRGVAFRIGPGSLLVLLVVGAALCVEALARRDPSRRNGRRAAAYALVAAVVAAAHVYGTIRAWGGVRDYLAYGIGSPLGAGNFEPIVSLVSDIVSTLALIAVVSEFVLRTLRTRQEMSALQERGRQTMEGYERLLAAQSAINALHHEMRHHMIALSGILKSGDAARAARYADAVAGDLDQLPTGRYSQNPLVDVIAGSFLDRARKRGIKVEYRLNVPAGLNIADEDLSVFLSNMLQNALEACERMEEGAERFIRVETRLRDSFLFMKCVNSAPEAEAVERVRPGHGYGLAAMRRIAEKYSSALVVERGEGEFSVMSDLCLRGD